ncbi:MAG TPA: sensor histidine kinase [Chitinophagaceae bacterium]|nr:sensor histidine kinase [Chitinophagaceae bacterium]
MMLPLITTPGPEGTNKIITVFQTSNYWVSIAIYLFVFYFNSYLLIPKLYLQKKYLLYTVAVIGMLAAAYFIKRSVDVPYFRNAVMNGERTPPPGDRPPGDRPFRDSMRPFNDSSRLFADTTRHFPGEMRGEGGPPPNDGNFGPRRQPFMRHPVDLFAIFLLCTIWALSTATRITQQWRETEKRAVKAEADKANAELSFLKAQINPHFLFNTLNNIYSLAVRQNENTAASIMKLSNIMRYVTDEVNRDFVSLQSEVECITDYIDLQRLRLNKKVLVDFSVTGNTEGKRIPPLVLMTFIENVFKYGISSHESSVIIIKLFAEEKSITFFCQNKLFATERKAERTGIGIINTKQRLEHMYPNRYLLNITTGDGFYTVQLTLQI